ncbi:Alpha/Beta hydrolase protein [Trametes elegans]|nr:Alpha/Beta hydrolase protein [Trametes elegans]
MRLHSSQWLTAVFGVLTLTPALVCATPLPRDDQGSQRLVQDGMRYVRNSGVCETTPGVQQVSGYVDVAANKSLFFWFFEARHEPETAPLTVLQSGPACSSMEGLFRETGPCRVNSDNKTTELNPYSWNNVSNVIYLDQTVGAGFSYGTADAATAADEAELIWKALQILLQSQEFAKYQSRDLVLAGPSYAGRFVPEFVTYANAQNVKAADRSREGVNINVTAIVIYDGWFDPRIQYESLLQFVKDAPGYGPLVDEDVSTKMNTTFYGSGGCNEKVLACYAAGETPESDQTCADAFQTCDVQVFTPAYGTRYECDLRQEATSHNLFPPRYSARFLGSKTIQDKIGAEVSYNDCSISSSAPFAESGDGARTTLPELSRLADSQMKISLWAGDVDIIGNWIGVHDAAIAMSWYGKDALANTPFTNVTLGGQDVASVKNVDNFSFARVFGAGCQLAAHKPEIALQFFSQVIRGEELHSGF